LQINSEDVANSTHDRCVQLIKSAGENLILKVTKPVGHVGTVLQTSPSVPGDVSFPLTVLFMAALCNRGAIIFLQKYIFLHYVARTPPFEARSAGRLSHVENTPRRWPVTGRPAMPTCDIRRAIFRTPVTRQ